MSPVGLAPSGTRTSAGTVMAKSGSHIRTGSAPFYTLRARPDGCHFPDDIFKCIFLNENARISLKKLLKFLRINNDPALVQIMAWRRSGDKPLSEPTMVSLPTHICVTRPQWVKISMLLGPPPLKSPLWWSQGYYLKQQRLFTRLPDVSTLLHLTYDRAPKSGVKWTNEK